MSKTWCILLGLGILGILVDIGECGEETCSWKEDGTKVCSEELDADEEDHNVWTDPGTEHFDNDETGDEVTNQDFNELELEMFVQFYSLLGDWNPTGSSLANYQPEKIISTILNTINTFDRNDDGFLEYDEVERVISEYEVRVELSRVQEIFSTYKEERISIFQCLDFFKKLGDGKITAPLLSPFDKIRGMPPADAKKILMGSVQMFLDSDEDGDGRLDKVEFAIGMKRSQQKRGLEADLPSEQIEALFDLIDKDKDEYLVYTEFQATLPEKPKSMDDILNEVFQETDLNSDGFLSKKEFEAHMKARSKKMKITGPTDDEITDGFHQLDTNDDEMLSVDEMKGLFEQLKNTQEKRMTEAFNGFDTDSNGVLSKDEVKIIVKGIEQNAGQKLDIDVFMSLLDQNKDGVVGMDEMQAILSKMMNVPGK